MSHHSLVDALSNQGLCIHEMYKSLREQIEKQGRVIVSINGIPGGGKTYIAGQLKNLAYRDEFGVGIIHTDDYLQVPRKARLAAGLSGYNNQSYDLELLTDHLTAISALPVGSSCDVEYPRYNSSKGRSSTNPLTFTGDGMVIVEGLKSFNPCLLESIGACIWIDGGRDARKQLRNYRDWNKGYKRADALINEKIHGRDWRCFNDENQKFIEKLNNAGKSRLVSELSACINRDEHTDVQNLERKDERRYFPCSAMCSE